MIPCYQIASSYFGTDIDPPLPNSISWFFDRYWSHIQHFQKQTDLQDLSGIAISIFSKYWSSNMLRVPKMIFSKMLWDLFLNHLESVGVSKVRNTGFSESWTVVTLTTSCLGSFCFHSIHISGPWSPPTSIETFKNKFRWAYVLSLFSWNSV